MPRPKKGEEHPKQDIADRISVLVAGGTTRDGLCEILGMSTATLYKHYSKELELGDQIAGATVITKIFQKVQKGEEWALKWWSARRMGWQETQRTELTGANGGPIRTDSEQNEDLEAIQSGLARLATAVGAKGIFSEPDDEAD